MWYVDGRRGRNNELYPRRVSITARVGSTHQYPALWVTYDKLHFAVIDPRLTPCYPMADGLQITTRSVRHCRLQAQFHLCVKSSRIGSREAPPPRGFHCRLGIQIEIDEIGEDLEAALWLKVAPGRSPNDGSW